jgi:hypothetical protein
VWASLDEKHYHVIRSVEHPVSFEGISTVGECGKVFVRYRVWGVGGPITEAVDLDLRSHAVVDSSTRFIFGNWLHDSFLLTRVRDGRSYLHEVDCHTMEIRLVKELPSGIWEVSSILANGDYIAVQVNEEYDSRLVRWTANADSIIALTDFHRQPVDFRVYENP